MNAASNEEEAVAESEQDGEESVAFENNLISSTSAQLYENTTAVDEHEVAN